MRTSSSKTAWWTCRRGAAGAPHLAIVSITAFGRTGPMAGRPWTEFTVQAESGSLLARGAPGLPPFQAGGRIGEWTAGSYAGAAATAAMLTARRTGVGVHVDCSMLEVMAIAGSTFTDMLHSLTGRPSLEGTVARGFETPSIELAADGWVGFNTNTGAMFQSFLLMIERPDLLEDSELAGLAGRVARIEEWSEIVRAWTTQHTVADILERAAELRIPATQVHDGRTVLDNEQLAARGVFVDEPGGFLQPRSPYVVDGAAVRAPGPAPTPRGGHGRDRVAVRLVRPRRALTDRATPREAHVAVRGRPDPRLHELVGGTVGHRACSRCSVPR